MDVKSWFEVPKRDSLRRNAGPLLFALGVIVAVFYATRGKIAEAGFFVGLGLLVFVVLNRAEILKFTVLGLSAEFRETVQSARVEVEKLRILARAVAGFSDGQLLERYAAGGASRTGALASFDQLRGALLASGFTGPVADEFPLLSRAVLIDASRAMGGGPIRALYEKAKADYARIHPRAYPDGVAADGVTPAHYVDLDYSWVVSCGLERTLDPKEALAKSLEEVRRLPPALAGQVQGRMCQILVDVFQELEPLLATGDLVAIDALGRRNALRAQDV